MNRYRVVVREVVETVKFVHAQNEDIARRIAAPDLDAPMRLGPPGASGVSVDSLRTVDRRVVDLSVTTAQERTP